MNYPGSYFHSLSGARAGRYSVRLTANVRVTFGWGDDSAVDIDIEDDLMTERHPSLVPAHPGEILREDVLPAVSMTKTAVARALGISRQTLYDIINEKQPVTAEMAVRFGKLFGNGAAFWLNLQRGSSDCRAHGGCVRDTDPRNTPWLSE